MFDQQRTGLSKRLSFYERRQLGQLLTPKQIDDLDDGEATSEQEEGSTSRFEPEPLGSTSDPRVILTSLAMRAQVAQDPEATEKEDFARLKSLYDQVCHPHTIGDLYNTEHGLDMEFRGPQGRYYFDGLSSGQG